MKKQKRQSRKEKGGEAEKPPSKTQGVYLPEIAEFEAWAWEESKRRKEALKPGKIIREILLWALAQKKAGKKLPFFS